MPMKRRHLKTIYVAINLLQRLLKKWTQNLKTLYVTIKLCEQGFLTREQITFKNIICYY